MFNRSMIVLFIITLCSLLIRYIPILTMDMPFSNDVWPLINTAEFIYSNPSLKIFGAAEFPSYHVQWPFSILYSVVHSTITGLQPLLFYKYIGGSIAGFSLVIMGYTFGKRFFEKSMKGLAFSITLSTFPSFTIYTSVFLKETYAHLVMLTTLMLILLSNKTVSYFVIPLVFVALILGHPLTSLIFSSVIALYIVNNKLEPITRRVSNSEILEIPRGLTLLTLILLVFTILYNTLYIRKPVIVFGANDLATLGVYALSIYLGYLLLGFTLIFYLYILILAIALVSLVLVITSPIGWSIVLYFLPFLCVLPIGIRPRTYDHGTHYITTKPLLIIVYTVFIYITTYFTIALSILHRFLNYLVYALGIYAARSVDRRKGIGVLGFVFTVTSIYLLLVATGAEPILFYWRYSVVDSKLNEFIRNSYKGDIVYGDVKYAYYISDIVKVTPPTVLLNLCSWLNSGNIIIYSQENLIYGFPVTPIDYVKIRDNILICSNILYNDEYTYVSGY